MSLIERNPEKALEKRIDELIKFQDDKLSGRTKSLCLSQVVLS